MKCVRFIVFASGIDTLQRVVEDADPYRACAIMRAATQGRPYGERIATSGCALLAMTDGAICTENF